MKSNAFQKTIAPPEPAFRPSLRLRLVGSEPFYGPGVAQLLGLIDRCGSVAGACQRMGLSYSKGRMMIARLERETGFSAVERTRGGPGGGSARLTERGKRFLQVYNAYERDAEDYIRGRFAAAFAEFVPAEGNKGETT